MENLLVSFSGGETSAFMSQWLNSHYEEYGYKNIVFVFANTSQERNETLDFVYLVDKKYNLNVQWVEADVFLYQRKSSGFYMVNYDTATRNNEWRKRDDTPFEMMIKKYGIPNTSFPHCTRELKQNPISSFGKQWFNGEPYHTAIGIRNDEIDRMNNKRKEMGFIYPLIHSNMIPATKPMVNFFWKQSPFRLGLKGYEGNCATCWKKSDKKLFQIAKENREYFDFMAEMEKKYGQVGAEFKIEGRDAEDRVFFRNKRSAIDILNQSEKWDGSVKDDSDQYTYQIDLLGGESCEVFSGCSD